MYHSVHARTHLTLEETDGYHRFLRELGVSERGQNGTPPKSGIWSYYNPTAGATGRHTCMCDTGGGQSAESKKRRRGRAFPLGGRGQKRWGVCASTQALRNGGAATFPSRASAAGPPTPSVDCLGGNLDRILGDLVKIPGFREKSFSPTPHSRGRRGGFTPPPA